MDQELLQELPIFIVNEPLDLTPSQYLLYILTILKSIQKTAGKKLSAALVALHGTARRMA